jgi:acylphosphatase
MVRRHVRAHGRVQGVFFRDSVRREAERRGVAGWARNCSDGTAEAVFEGDAEAVEAMVEWLTRRLRVSRGSALAEGLAA